MPKSNRFLSIGSLLILLLGIVLAGAWLLFSKGQSGSYLFQSSTTASNPCRGGWTQMPIDISKHVAIGLQGVAAISSKDIWTVGDNLIEHWDGTQWQPVQTVATNDVWAVGSGFFTGDSTVTGASGLIEHWDGQTWSYIPISGPESRSNELVSIKAISPTNIWAVGTFVNPNTRLQNAYMQH